MPDTRIGTSADYFMYHVIAQKGKKGELTLIPYKWYAKLAHIAGRQVIPSSLLLISSNILYLYTKQSRKNK